MDTAVDEPELRSTGLGVGGATGLDADRARRGADSGDGYAASGLKRTAAFGRIGELWIRERG